MLTMNRFLNFSEYLVNLGIKSNILLALINMLIIILVSYIVFITGGTKFAYLHLMYAPIVLSGILGGVTSGILISFFAGVILALMPHDVEANLPQPINSILMRMILFGLMGFLTGIFSNIFRYYIREIEKSYLHDYATGVLNRGGIAKLFKENIADSNNEHIVICLEISNSEGLQRFLGYNDYISIMRTIAVSLKKFLPKGGIIGANDSKTFVIVV